MNVDNDFQVQTMLADMRTSTIPVSPRIVRIAAEYISSMYDFLVEEARCACCDEVDICSDECTFADDCPDEAERMEYVREVLRLPE